MSNYYSKYSKKDLLELRARKEKNLQQLGELYNGTFEDLTYFQKTCLEEFTKNDISYDIQIHQTYNEIGAINKELRKFDERKSDG